jgi:hypothetical protein
VPSPSADDLRNEAIATPEIAAFAEVLKVAVPGLKIPHTTLAGQMDRMLRKRGFCVAALSSGGGEVGEYKLVRFVEKERPPIVIEDPDAPAPDGEA